LLLAYGISKISITQLKSGDYNFQKLKEKFFTKRKCFSKQKNPTNY
jgi:hypothetical protein